MSAVIIYIGKMLPFMLMALPVVLAMRFTAWFINRKKGIRTTVLHEVFFFVFAAFAAGLISQTILPKLEISPAGIRFLDTAGVSSFNFIPGSIFATSSAYMTSGYKSYFIINFLGNVGMFVPIGLMVPLLWRCSLKKTVLIGFLCSLSIELLQIPQPRCTDIDDLWMNTMGAVIGALVYLLLDKLFPRFTRLFKTASASASGEDGVTADEKI